ncbi:uncharacterized protein LOC131318720 isoform X2 [Rhododendron vialii]|uniref:uncharacterized protein LOC131318720 isoform X2 n=1 Tax=Rhododendron vialii TaxID=182163 RepID=UPI00265F4F88|nr:uncharacterized protein LOC131318720 isoform X2 [Rhododendron vialii]
MVHSPLSLSLSQMNTRCMPCSLYPDISASWRSNHKQSITLSFKSSIIHHNACAYCHLQGKIPSKSWKLLSVCRSKKTWRCLSKLGEEPPNLSKKKGTIGGAVALIIGTSIGSGILALPQKTSPAGLLPSSITMTICWAFLVIEALLLVEINVGLLRKKKRTVQEEEDDQLEVISLRTMAQETLGEWGGTLATVTYVFLGYTSLVAYSSKSGEIIYHLINLPESFSGFFFTVLFTVLISVGGTRATDRVNQWLTLSMIVLCAYLEGDLRRIRTSVLLGSVVPLLALLVWDAIALSLSSQSDHQVADPVELLIMSGRWNGVSFMVKAFSLLAVGTSMIGTLLGFSEFFKEQLNNISLNSPSTQTPDHLFVLRKWWGRNKVSFTATAMVIAPPLFVSTVVPDAFSAATDIAGGYCMTMLYGVLPPAMAWAAMTNRENEEKKTDQKAISTTRPALLGVGLFACGIILEQIFHDLSMLHF